MYAIKPSFALCHVLACFSLLHSTGAQNLTDLQSQLELFWSYGPPTTGTGRWAESYAQAVALVAQMTNAEKENITYGYTSTTNGCSGNSGGVPRLNFPGLCLNDAGNGVRGSDLTNGYAAGVHVGAAWNKELAYDRARFMGAEFKAKGINVALGPVVGPLGRIAEGGRNWEGFSNDPYLCGSLAYDTVIGLQESVIATVKHFIANEQETNRNPTSLSAPGTINASVSSNLDDKTMHELYLWPFQDAVRAGSGAVMCSYNRINNSYGCQNSKTMNGLLKTELGFQGFVVSDWYAQHTGIASANAGLDMAMPDSPYWAGNLTAAATNGSLPQSRLDDMATRIVAAWYRLAPFEHPGYGMPLDLTAPHAPVDARNPAAKDTIFQGAVEGHVLVKNVNKALPLRSPKILSLFGYDAIAMAQNSPSLLAWALGYEPVDVPTSQIYPILIGSNSVSPETAVNGTLITGGGSGAATPAYVNAPYDAFQQRAYDDGTWLAWDFVSQDPVVDGASDACIVFINEFSSEGFDRPGLADNASDVLVANVAAKCNNTMVVIHNAGVRLVDAWIENVNITAVVYAHLPGQDSGRSLVQVMYGEQSPSGRLPYTVAKSASDYGSLESPTRPDNTSDYYTQSNFTEGVYIDYRYFAQQNLTPRYEFGYGLTYTTFNYTSLRTATATGVDLSLLPPASAITEGGLPSLWDIVATVDCLVANVGDVAAAEVAQLYVGVEEGGPEKVLRGFWKQTIQPGARAEAHFELTRRDLSYWDMVRQSWVLEARSYPVYVGKSVLDIQLVGNITIN